MKNQIVNKAVIAGKLFSFKLEKKTVSKQGDNFGKEFIRGEIDIQTDEEGLNVVPIYYNFITPTFSKSGKKDSRYDILEEIINTKASVEEVGPEKAMILSTSGSIGVNDYYDINNTKQIVSQTRVENAFINKITAIPEDESKRNEFTLDAILNNVKVIEEDEEKGIDKTYIEISGATFDFRKALIPITFTLRDPDGIDFILGMDLSSKNPFFTKIWGMIRNATIKIPHTEEAAWGPAKVTYTTKIEREYLISGLNGSGYGFGDEDSITENELKTIIQNREVHLAEVKQQREQYAAEQNTISATVSPKGTVSGFTVATNKAFNF